MSDFKAKIALQNWSRAPESLSDRWSSLATIYPLHFHEIFGRWLSYNIKRWLSLASIDPLRFHEFFQRWLSYNIKRRTKIEDITYMESNIRRIKFPKQ